MIRLGFYLQIIFAYLKYFVTFSITLFCRKNVRVNQSRFYPVSCLSRPVANRPTEVAYREKSGLAYAHAFSAEWNTADRGFCIVSNL